MADIDINVSDRDAADKQISPAEFARTIAGENAEIHIRIFDDKKRGIFKGKKLCFTANELEDHLDELNKYNPFSFTSTTRLLFSCNNLPKNIADRSDVFSAD